MRTVNLGSSAPCGLRTGIDEQVRLRAVPTGIPASRLDVCASLHGNRRRRVGAKTCSVMGSIATQGSQ